MLWQKPKFLPVNVSNMVCEGTFVFALTHMLGVNFIKYA
jgi:hypothetical protein